MRVSDTHRTPGSSPPGGSSASTALPASLGAREGPARTRNLVASKPPKTRVDPTESPRSSGDDSCDGSTRRTHSLVAPSLSTMRESARVRHVRAGAETDALNGRVLPPSESPERCDREVDGGI